MLSCAKNLVTHQVTRHVLLSVKQSDTICHRTNLKNTHSMLIRPSATWNTNCMSIWESSAVLCSVPSPVLTSISVHTCDVWAATLLLSTHCLIHSMHHFITYHVQQLTHQATAYRIGLCSVLRPCKHSIGYMGDGFYRSKDPTNSIKVLKKFYKGQIKQRKQQNTHMHRQ